MNNLFTEDEITRLTGIIDRNAIILVVKIIGNQVLTPLDELTLKNHGINPEDLISKFPPYYQAYLFGRLTANLSTNQGKQIEFKDFTTYLKKNQFQQPSRRELAEYKIASRKTYEYIKGMGERKKKALTDYVTEADLDYQIKIRKEQNVIKEKISDGTLRRQAVKKITSNIGTQLNDWQRDWGRIVETECQNIFTLGAAQTIMDEHGVDAKVYYDVYPGACRHCIRLYLTNGIGSQPKTFTIEELVNNGTNIGRKAKNWKPVLGTVHPFCRCNLRVLPTNYKWDKEKKKFEIPKNISIQRKSKVKITIGENEFII